MTTYFTSDLHIGHRKIMDYCPTSRASANNDLRLMKQLIIDGINSRVDSNDTLYMLGDIAFTTNEREVEEFLLSLNVQNIHLILGNHDHTILDSKHLQKYFRSIYDYKQIKIGNDRIVMMHYPIESWNHKFHGSYHLHGHTHARNDHLNEDVHRGELSYQSRRFDVGIDGRTDFMPWSWEEIKEFIAHREAIKSFSEMMDQGV